MEGELSLRETRGRSLEIELGDMRWGAESGTRRLGGKPGAHSHGGRRLDLNEEARIEHGLDRLSGLEVR